MARSASRQASSHAGSSGPRDVDLVHLAGHGERALGPPAAVAGRDDLDVVAGEQARDRARQRGVAVDHDPLDLLPQLTGQQQPVGADHVVAGATPAGRLGEERPARLLGEDAGGRAGVVPGDDDRAGPGLEDQSLHGRGGRGRPRRRVLGGGLPAPVVGQQRLVELHVEVHRPVALVAADEREDRVEIGARRRRASAAKEPKIPTWSVVWLAPVPRRRAGPVGGHDHQRHTGVRGLDHGGQEVGHGRARGARHRRGAVADLREAEGEEAGGPLVDARVQAQAPAGGGVVEREGERRVAGAGRDAPPHAPRRRGARSPRCRASSVEGLVTLADPALPTPAGRASGPPGPREPRAAPAPRRPPRAGPPAACRRPAASAR